MQFVTEGVIGKTLLGQHNLDVLGTTIPSSGQKPAFIKDDHERGVELLGPFFSWSFAFSKTLHRHAFLAKS